MPTDRFDAADGGYVPDPDRDSAAVIDGFFDYLAVVVRERALPDELVVAVRVRLGEFERERSGLIVDEPSRYNLRMTLALVAAYETLRPLVWMLCRIRSG